MARFFTEYATRAVEAGAAAAAAGRDEGGQWRVQVRGGVGVADGEIDEMLGFQ